MSPSSLVRSLVALTVLIGLGWTLTFAAPHDRLTPPGIMGASFTDIGAGLEGVASASVAWGDYDNDGDLDILLSGSGTSNVPVTKIYANTGGVFTDIGVGLTGASNASVAWGDYDNDGDVDVLSTGLGVGSSRIAKVYNNQVGFFGDIGAGLVGVQLSSVAWGDFDSDGDLDILLSGFSASGATTRLYRNTGSGFVDAAAGLIGVYSSSVAWGDYDRDGDLDILLTRLDASGTPRAIVYRNTPAGFIDIGAGLTGVSSSAVAWGDVDGDGDLDILMAGSDLVGNRRTTVYENTPGGFVAAAAAGLPGLSSCSVAWGDYDNDGDLDIALAGLDSTFTRIAKVYENTAGVFSDIGAGLTGVNGGSVAWGDYDNDGDLDLLLAGTDAFGVKITKVYQNGSTTPNTVPTAPGNLRATWTASHVTFSWDPASDAETPSAGLGYNIVVGTSPGGTQRISPMSQLPTGLRRIVRLGNANQNLSWSIVRPATPRLYWSVQAVDAAFAGSPFAPELQTTPDPVISAVADIPGDQGGNVRLTVLASALDNAGESAYPISQYNVWRRVDDTSLAGAIRSSAVAGWSGALVPESARQIMGIHVDLWNWNGRLFLAPGSAAAGVAPAFPPGLWEIVGSFAAAQQPNYLVATRTLADSTAEGGIFWSTYLVSAHTTTPSIWYLSAADSGYSVDNLAPGVPQGFLATHQQGGVSLTWSPAPERDFRFFRVYRGATPDFVPAPGNMIQETAGTTWLDSPPNPAAAFYRITALDHAGNESPPTGSTAVSGVLEGHSPPVVMLATGSPNPFRTTTTIEFQLSHDTEMSIEIFDMGGRRVRSLLRGHRRAGVHAARWDGSDDDGNPLSAGLYLYRLQAGGKQLTGRLTRIR